MKILQDPDPRLRTIAAEVTEFNEELRTTASRMVAALIAHEGAGLAGTQVDYHYRIVVVMRDGEPIVMVNPKITSTFSTEGHREGCLSVKRGALRVFKKRHRNITVEYQDLDGAKQVQKARGFLSACIQHEMAHLFGILITD